MSGRVLGTVLASMLLALVAAQPARGAGCQAEIEKFCKDERGTTAKCLRAHQSELSDECKAHLAFFERMPSCLSDAARLCPSEKPSGPAVIKCLRGRQTDLSDDCRKEIGQIR